MILFFLIGFIFVVLILFFRKTLFHFVGEKNRLVRMLKSAKWFQHVWLAGLFVFLMNAILFGLTFFVLFILMRFDIPFLYLFVMMGAVVVSILFWMIVNRSWMDSKKSQLKMAVIGSSFYLLLTLTFLYIYVTIEPFYPGEDMFMRALGLSLAMMVTFVAWISCFVIVGLTTKTQV